jgi:hypothetical protein
LTEVAYENGTSALLLLLTGTLPVTFRGATYGFPVAIWVPYAYPREPPIVYVTPSQDMVLRPGQHVSTDGRIYHPYLAQWEKYWDVSIALSFAGHRTAYSITDMISDDCAEIYVLRFPSGTARGLRKGTPGSIEAAAAPT